MSDATDKADRSAPTVLDVRADLAARPWVLPDDAPHGEIRGVGLVRDGAGPGRPSVAIVAVLPGIGPVVVETTLKLAASAVTFLHLAPIYLETQ